MDFVQNTFSRIKAEPRPLFVALLWVCLMFLFTYTDLVVALCKTGDTFTPAFMTLHMRSISLFVNFGLIIMLLYDYTAKRDHINKMWLWTIVLGLFLVLSIYFHCQKVSKETHTELITPLNWDSFGLMLFIIFLIMIFVLKSCVEFSEPVKVEDKIRK